MTTAETTTLAVQELQAQAFAVDSALGNIFLALERGHDFYTIWKYQRIGWREMDKLRGLLKKYWKELSYHQLSRVAELLEMAELVNPLSENCDDHYWPERYVHNRICKLQNVVDSLVRILRAEAKRRGRAFGRPTLLQYHRQQAAFANVFLRPVIPDSAEALADPDYGF